MKTIKLHIALFLLLLLSGLTASAQTDKEDIAIARAIFGKTKKAIIVEHIRLSEQEQNGFWALYDEYEGKVLAISTDRLELIGRYASQYQSLNDESASTLATEYLDNNAKYTALYKVYLKKFSKQIGGLRAATLIQLEIYIQTAIQAKLQQQIPVIGDLRPDQH